MLLQTKNYRDFTLSSGQTFHDFRQANHCLPGDTVNWIEDKCVLVTRKVHRFIPGVLELNSKTIYGHSTRGSKLYLFHPLDPKYPPFRVGSKEKNSSRNQLGLVEWMQWEDHEAMPRGNLMRVLGECGDLDAEKTALTYQYSNPKLSAQLFDIQDVDYKSRVLLDGFTFNIDPDGCLDIDDVFTVKKISEEEWEFTITISDVAAHIPEKSDGDIHAYELGQTLYQNGDSSPRGQAHSTTTSIKGGGSEAVVPMLPGPLSEMALSLRANELHAGISLFCTWNTQTKQLTVGEFKETVFKNNMSFTYETIYKTKEFPLEILKDIASFLQGKQVLDSHDWVAECMILYNKEVAKKLLEHRTGLLRTHKPAKAEVLQFFTSLHPDLKALAYESAKYEPTEQNKIHAGLGSVPYCHASSPIRRYADLVNQRCLKAILQGKEVLPASSVLAEHLNAIQKRMRHYERALFFLEQINMSPSGTVEGLVLDCNEARTKVYIPSWKHTIKVEGGNYSIGEKVSVDYYADLQKPKWEQRMVFRLNSSADTNVVHDE